MSDRLTAQRSRIFNWLRNALWAVLGIIIVLPIAGGIVGIKALQFKAMGQAAAEQVPPPELVNVAEVSEERFQPRISSVGTVTAVQGTIIMAEADGVVRQINFDGGSEIETGRELVKLDADIEHAQLNAAMASLELARISHERARKLIVSRSIAQADLDSAYAMLKQTSAQVENIQAAIGKKTVRAPFTGKLGIRQVSIGQFLTKGSPVVSLQSLDPVYVEFSLPQQQLGQLAEELTVAVSSDSYPGEMFEGKITAINPDVDRDTRNIRVQATLPNPDHRLRPGMFVSLEVSLAMEYGCFQRPRRVRLYRHPLPESIGLDFRYGSKSSSSYQVICCPVRSRKQTVDGGLKLRFRPSWTKLSMPHLSRMLHKHYAPAVVKG